MFDKLRVIWQDMKQGWAESRNEAAGLERGGWEGIRASGGNVLPALIVLPVHITPSMTYMFGPGLTSVGVDNEGNIHTEYNHGSSRKLFVWFDVNV